MKNGNCFQKNIVRTTRGRYETGKEEKRKENKNTDPIITKVLMNPPFALKKSDEKESAFIDYAISQMQDGGVLFAIVPVSVMIERGGREWRKRLLQKNTLLSVITLPEELFYPIGVHTVGVFLKKGVPHDFENQKVYFCKANTDGFIKMKGKRIFSEEESNKLFEIKDELKSFIANQKIKVKNVPEFKQVTKLDKDDKILELVPEEYLETDYSTLKEKDFEENLRKFISFKILNKS